LFLVDLVAEVLGPVAEEFPGVRVEGVAGALVLGDPGRLRQLLRNLAANAVRAAGAGGVTLRLAATPTQVQLSVHDSGPGIPPEQQARVFEKFWTAGGGSGLGLAIARQIAHAHAGELRLVSRPGDTTFTLELPRIEEDEGEA